MKWKLPIFLILFSSCVTLDKFNEYAKKHPEAVASLCPTADTVTKHSTVIRIDTVLLPDLASGDDTQALIDLLISNERMTCSDRLDSLAKIKAKIQWKTRVITKTINNRDSIKIYIKEKTQISHPINKFDWWKLCALSLIAVIFIYIVYRLIRG